jgi:hypothetical protein
MTVEPVGPPVPGMPILGNDGGTHLECRLLRPSGGTQVSDQPHAGALAHCRYACYGGRLIAEGRRHRHDGTVRGLEPEPETRVPVNEYFKHSRHANPSGLRAPPGSSCAAGQAGTHRCARLPLLW